MASDVKTVNGSLASATNGKAIAYANGSASLYLGGTFSGTVQLGVSPADGSNATPEPLAPIGASSGSITAAGMYAFPRLAGDWIYTVMCTAYTSGTINYELALGPAV